MIRRPPRSTVLPFATLFFFFFNDTATTEIYTLSLHDALPIYGDVDHVYLAANAHWEGHTVELPILPPGLRWHLFADTSAPAPGDVTVAGQEPQLVDQSSIPVGPRSVVALVAHRSA